MKPLNIFTAAFLGLTLLGGSAGNAQTTNATAKNAKERVATQEKKIDQTGIQWVMPFDKALAKAKAEKRLIAIKMIAFGSNASGCW